MSLKSLYAYVRWFFSRIESEVYHKSLLETFSVLGFSSRDVHGHVVTSLKMKIQHYAWTVDKCKRKCNSCIYSGMTFY